MKIDFGKIDYNGSGGRINRVTVEIEYKEIAEGKKEFTASADVWNALETDIICAGQCLDALEPYFRNNPLYMEILRLWENYHLNGMHPECEHQAKLGWREIAKKPVTLYKWKLNYEAIKEQNAAEKMAKAALQEGKTFTPTEHETFMANLGYKITTAEDKLPEDIAKYYKPDGTETKTCGWLYETEHPEGILGKPCPVCGYKYGTAWNYFPIPKEDEDIIYKILKGEYV